MVWCRVCCQVGSHLWLSSHVQKMKRDQMLSPQPHVPHFQCSVAACAGLVVDADDMGDPIITESLLGHYCPRVSQVHQCSLCEQRQPPVGSVFVAPMPSPVRLQRLRPLVPGLRSSGHSRHGCPHVPKSVRVCIFSEVMGLRKKIYVTVVRKQQ